ASQERLERRAPPHHGGGLQCRENRQAINRCPVLSRQCIFHFATRLVRATAGDIQRYVRSLERAAKVGDVASYLSKIEALFTTCQGPCHEARVDIVERDPPEDVFWRVPEEDNGGRLRGLDDFPVAADQSARRQ